METVECFTCGCEYTVFQNNDYGYYNCCKECGQNKYEEEQEKELPVLPNDIFSLILNIRGEEMKNDLYKKKFNNCIADINYLGETMCDGWDEEEWENDHSDEYSHYYRIENIFDTITDWKIDEAQEDALDKYLESQEADYSTHPSLLALS